MPYRCFHGNVTSMEDLCTIFLLNLQFYNLTPLGTSTTLAKNLLSDLYIDLFDGHSIFC